MSSSYSGPLVRITIASSYYDVYPDIITQNLTLHSTVSASYVSYNSLATGATANTLASALGNNSATVAIWYDQSGNGRNVSQATTSLQPSIITSGVINLKNGVPTIYFNNQKLISSPFSNAYNSAFTLTYVAGVKNNLSLNTFVTKTTGNFASPFDLYNSSILYGSSTNWTTLPLTNAITSSSAFSQWTFTANSSTGNAYRNGSSNGAIATSYSINDNLSTSLIFGSRADGNSSLDGWISEFVAFNSVLSTTDRQTIENNQQLNYGISPPTISSFTPTSGAAGNTITIVGTGLVSTTAVSFGGTPATSFAVISNNIITAKLNTGTTGNVSVTTAGGTATLSGFTFIPAPTVTSFSPTFGPVGTTVTITGTNFDPTASNNIVYFGAAKAPVISASSTSLLIAVPFGAASVAPITVINKTTARQTNSLSLTSPGVSLFTVTSPTTLTINSAAYSASFGPALSPGSYITAFGYFNEDNFIDMAASDINNNDINVLLGDGVGGFSAPTQFNVGAKPFDIKVGDLNNDGFDDIVSTNDNGQSLSILISNGNGGGFIIKPGISWSGTTNDTYRLALGDFNKDGVLDIIVTSFYDNIIRTYLGDGTGLFSAGSPFAFSGGSRSAAVVSGDFNSDGNLDFALGDVNSNTVLLGLGDGSGHFTEGTSNLIGGTFPSSLAASDFNNDGKLDLVVALNGSNQVSVLLGDGSGSLSLSSGSPYAAGGATRTVAAGDFNGDGFADFVTCLTGGGIKIGLGDGSGSISSLSLISNDPGFYIGTTDLNNDGRADLVSGNGSLRAYIYTTPPPTVSSFSPTSGSEGTLVTITGVDFTAATGVSFGSTPAISFNVVSSTSITAVAGAGSTGNISVTTPAGTGALAGFTSTPLSPPGNALNFDGANDFVEILDNPSLNFGNSSFTWEAWLQFSASQVDYAGIMAKVSGSPVGIQWVLVGNKVAAEFFPDGVNAVGVANGLQGTTALNDGHWHHVALVLDKANKNMKLYVDGRVEASVNSNYFASTIDNSSSLFIGKERNSTVYYNGTLDEVRIYNSALSQANIVLDMTSTLPSLPLNLVAYYNFDEGVAKAANPTTTLLADSKSFNHGVLNSFSLTGATSNWVESYALVVPTSLTATSITATSFTANWTAPLVGTVVNYQLDVSISPTFASFVTGYNALSVSGLSQAVTGLAAGTTYYYRVRADKTSVTGQGANASTVTLNTIPPPTISSFTPTTAASGTTVTLTGANLTGVTGVSFGGVQAASFTIVSNSSITAIVGSGGSGSISVDAPWGTATSPGFTFIPAPTITSFAPTTAASGATITIIGANLNGATAVSFGGIPAASFAVVSGTTITAVVGSGGTGALSVTTSGGTGTVAGFTFIPAPTITSFTPASAPLGATVTILGTDFTNTSDVSFGGIAAANFSVLSNTTITAVVGSGSSGNISIATPGGNATSSGFSFIPAPVISNISPGTAAGGATVTITGTDLTGATAVSFAGIPASSFTIVSSTSITAIVPPNSSGQISVTTPGGTSASSSSFTFIPPPTVTTFTPTLAGSGTTVLITGTHFTDVSAVSFGGTPAVSFKVISNTNISAVIGNGSNGVVSVTASGGTATLPGFTTFSLNALDALSLTGLTPAAGAYSLRLLSTSYTGPLVRVAINNKFYDVYPDAVTKSISLTSSISARYDTIITIPSGVTLNSFATVLGNNAATVAIWYDQSGYGRNVSQPIASLQPSLATAGVINMLYGAPVVYFNNQKLSSIGFSKAYNDAFTLALVAGVKNNLSNSTFVSKTTGNLPSPFDLYNTNFLFGSASSWSTLNFTNGFDSSVGFSQWTFTADSISGAAYRNGVANGTLSGSMMIVDSLNSPLVFGTRDDGVTSLDGWISEFVSFNTVLSNADRLAVERSQLGAFGITSPTIASFTPTRAATGTPVMINGTGLAGTTAVNFGGIAASSFSVMSSTTVVAVVASGSSGDVSIASSGGTYSKPGFTFIDPPTITSFSPTSGSEGTTIMITGTNFNDTTVVTFGGTAAASFKVISSTAIAAVVGTGSSGNVAVTTAGGTATSPGFIFTGVPNILGFAPVVGDVGSTVTITGAGFNPQASNNIVYFGATRAQVVTATPAQLVVMVPPGATYAPIAVLNAPTSLWALSTQNFSPTFSPNKGSIIAADFSATPDLTVGTNAPSIAFGDIDGDGLADLVYANSTKNNVSVLRNISVNGSLTYDSKLEFAVGNAPKSLAINDFDGDGKPDIAVINQTDNTVSILINKSTSSINFAPKVDFGTGASPTSLAAGDVDKDGKTDVVVANFNAASISVLRNISSLGTPNFDNKVDYITGFGPSSISICDADGDGLIDLAVANFNSGKITVLINQSSLGLVNYSIATNLTTGARPNYVTSGDLDGDGRMDIAAINFSSNSVSVFRNLSVIDTVKYADKVDFTVGSSPTAATLGDLDGDGKVDLLIANSGTPSLSVLRNTGTIGALAFNTRVDLTLSSNPISIAIDDVNNDGKADVIAGNSGNTISFILNTPLFPPTITSFTPTAATSGGVIAISGTNFTGTKSVTFGGIAAASFSVVSNSLINATPATGASGSITLVTPAGTATADGFTFLKATPSITSFTPAAGAVGSQVTINGINFNPTITNNIVFFGATRASVSTATSTQLTVTVPPGATYAPITLLDLTSSLIAYSPSNFMPTFSSSKGGINTSYFVPKIDVGVGSSPLALAVADVDGDGNDDLISVNYTGNSLSVLRNTSSNRVMSYAPSVELSTGGGPYAIGIADFTGDGKKDLAVANETASTVSVFVNKGTKGSVIFAPKVDFAVGIKPHALTLGDFDGDGRTDLAAANSGSNSVSILRNIATAGVPAFSSKVDFVSGAAPQAIATGDLDNDGRSDLIIANASSNSISVLRNTGSIGTLSFDSKIDFSSGFGPTALSIGDLDGDGLLDISVANQLSDNISIFQNISGQGIVNLAARIEFSTGKNPSSIAIGDVDGDGKADLVASSFFSNTLSVFSNASSAGKVSFNSKVDFASGKSPSSVVLADLDGDGLTDLASANSNANSVSILRNNPAVPPSISSFAPTSTASGATVTITGTNFNNASAVSFGGVAAASFTVVSSTTITAVLAAGTSGDISITAPGGVAAKSGFVFIGLPTIASFAPTTGGGGTQITITGSGFTGTSSVSFGTAAANYTVVSATSITATVPPNAGGTITVSSSGGVVKVDGFTFIPLPVITSFSPTSAAAGSTITITGTELTGALNVKFGAVAATSITVVSPTTVKAVVGSGGSGSVSVATPGGVANLPGFSFLPSAPVITSFAPIAAIAGATVTITGNRFNPTATGNIVYFGATKATVTSASANSLSVTVPSGATFGPLTVLNASLNLVAYSTANFTPLFTQGKGSITNRDFSAKSDYKTGSGPQDVALADLDGDGRADLAITNSADNTFSVLRNTGSQASLGFADKIDFTTSLAPNAIATGDLDGDGKVDIAVSNSASNSVSLFKNVSTSGTINFAPKVDVATGANPLSVSIGDLDGDGKADLVVTNGADGTLSVLLNSGSLGNLVFANKIDFATGSNPFSTALADVDGDGNTDVAVANNGNNTVSILRNTSSLGVINFETPVVVSTGSAPYTISAGDLDADGKIDLSVTNSNSSSFSAFLNTSAAGKVSFASKVDFVTSGLPVSLALGDLDGDGNIDVAISNATANTVSLFHNTSKKGLISMDGKVDLATATSPLSAAIGDLDGDGKPDLAIADFGSGVVSILKNNPVTGVTKADQVITFENLNDKVITDGSFNLIATSSSQLSVVFTSSNSKLTIAGNTATLVSAGRATITASQAGNDSYNPAVSVSRSFCIKPAKPTITISKTDASLLTSSSSTGNQWFKDGVIITGATAATYSATTAGSYRVQVKFDDCASEFSDPQVFAVTGDISTSSSDIEVYPVPSRDWLFVSFGDDAGKKKLTVFDLIGRSIFTEEVSGKDARLDVSTIGAGIYYLRIEAGEKTTVLRFVVQ